MKISLSHQRYKSYQGRGSTSRFKMNIQKMKGSALLASTSPFSKMVQPVDGEPHQRSPTAAWERGQYGQAKACCGERHRSEGTVTRIKNQQMPPSNQLIVNQLQICLRDQMMPFANLSQARTFFPRSPYGRCRFATTALFHTAAASLVLLFKLIKTK